MDAQKIDDMPPLPDMAHIALVEGYQGSEYRMPSKNYAPGHAMFSEVHMRAYAREYAAQTLASKEAELVRLRAELSNIAFARRFDREYFSDDTAFADWAISRAGHALTQPPKEPT